MFRKCLIAIALVGLCGPSAMAHVMWGTNQTTTIEWEWEKRFGPEIPVHVNVVMWAELYFRYNTEENRDTCLVLRQQDDNNFFDCIDMLLCVNFQGILVGAKYVWFHDPTYGNDGKNYRIAVLNGGEDPHTTPDGWSDWAVQPSDELHVTTQHLTGHLKVITICLEARNVDPQAFIGTADGDQVDVGTVFTTLTPTIIPPGVVIPSPGP